MKCPHCESKIEKPNIENPMYDKDELKKITTDNNVKLGRTINNRVVLTIFTCPSCEKILNITWLSFFD